VNHPEASYEANRTFAAGAARVFMSHRREETPWARELQRAARQCCGLELYSFPYDEAGGEDWRDRCRQLIAAADGLVCLVGSTTAGSSNIAWELEEAARCGMPVLLAGPQARTWTDLSVCDRVEIVDSRAPHDILTRLRELL
jgi:TIR domain-containing protein